LFGTFGVKGDLTPLSIQKLTQIRENQVSVWNQKNCARPRLF
jgi:hypothetical protein